MKNNNISVGKLISSLLFTLVSVYVLYNCVIYALFFHSVRKLPQIRLEDYMHVLVYGSSSEGNTVSANFSIIDSNGNEIATIERSWSGAYLEVQFNYIELYGKTFYFPSKIYGKDHIFEAKNKYKRTTALEKYYDENGQCMLLGYGSSLKERRALYILSRFANRKFYIIDFGISKKMIVDLSNCENNIFYSISTNGHGDLSIYQL